MQPLQICIGPIIRIGRESWCLPYAGFFLIISYPVCFKSCFLRKSQKMPKMPDSSRRVSSQSDDWPRGHTVVFGPFNEITGIKYIPSHQDCLLPNPRAKQTEIYMIITFSTI